MSYVTLVQNNFIGGEVSPLIEGRVESPKYQTGLRKCQNALPLRYGGWTKRPGSHYAGTTNGNHKSRLVEFIDADSLCYVIEFTNLAVRIWSQAYLTTIGAPTVLTTPWIESALPDLSATCIGGRLYVVHPDYAPRAITNITGTWQLETPAFTGDRTFSTAGNYPGIVFTLAGRLGFGATENEPTSIFLSRSPDAMTGAVRYTDFEFTSNGGYVSADNAIYLLESDLTPILWAIGGRRLFTGTQRQIWMDVGAGVTPVDLDMAVLSNNGSSTTQAIMSEAVIVYVGRGGKTLQALFYDPGSDAYQQATLSIGAEHFLASPIVDMAIQNFPYPVLWLVRQDGLLVSCSIDASNGMIAWARHPMDDGAFVESVAVGHSGTEDIMWMTVLRGTTRTVEYIRFQDITEVDDDDFHYVDCGLALSYGTPTATITGLAHLEGKTVSAWADGTVLPDKIVASGQVVYAAPISEIHIGLPMTTDVETLRPEIPVNGTGQGKFKQVEKATVRLYRSAGGSIGLSGGSKTALAIWKVGTQTWDAISTPYTGDIEANLAAPIEKDARLSVYHKSPAPFNLLAVMYRVGIKEP